MSSINNVEFLSNLIESQYTVSKKEVIDQYQMSFEVGKDDIHNILTTLKSHGWIQLSYMSAIDWLEDGEFELVYIVFNWEQPVYVQIRTRIPREEASMNTILPIYPGVKYYEREAHEYFGIAFPGNPDFHKPLIMEGWDDMPPLRKDFDPEVYSDAHFPKRLLKEPYEKLEGNESIQKKRATRLEKIQKVFKGGKK